jgi:phosphatidylinositol alpha-1,6-mannosyltransferase
MILGAFTGLLAHGGTQRAGRLAAAVLARRAAAEGEFFRALGLNDPPGVHSLETEAGPIQIEGLGGRKDRMARAVAGTAGRARLFYMNHPNLAPLGLIFRSLNRKAPYSVNAHGIDVWEPLPALWRFALRGAARVACPSRYTAQRLSTLQGVAAQRIRVIEWGLETAFLRAAETEHSATSKTGRALTLLAVSRLAKTEQRKGFEASLKAFAALANDFPQARFVFAGDGDGRADLEALASKLGVSERVEFPGAVPDEALYDLYRACDVFVMPSVKEGFGLTYLEAAAFGKPSIGGNDGGAPEVVLDGVTGLLAPWDDANAIGDCLSHLLEDAGLRERLGQAARQRVEKEFTFAQFEERFAKMLNEVLLTHK